MRTGGVADPGAAGADPVEAHRGLLFSVAYRMLGSAAAAEDVVQEAWLRWSTVDDPVAEPRAYLVRVVTRLCLDELRSARTRRESYVGPWLPEPVLTGTSGAEGGDPLAVVERREQVALGAVVLLERLSPAERAALVLHEALSLGHAEIAEILGVTEVMSRQLLTRARRRLADGGRRRPADPRARHRLVEALLAAFEDGDMGRLVELLRDDVRLVADGGGAVRAPRRPLLGIDKVLRFLAGARTRTEPGTTARRAEVNGEPAIVVSVGGVPTAVAVILVDDDRGVEVLLVANPAKLAYLRGQVAAGTDAQPA